MWWIFVDGYTCLGGTCWFRLQGCLGSETSLLPGSWKPRIHFLNEKDTGTSPGTDQCLPPKPHFSTLFQHVSSAGSLEKAVIIPFLCSYFLLVRKAHGDSEGGLVMLLTIYFLLTLQRGHLNIRAVGPPAVVFFNYPFKFFSKLYYAS
jgi:hypothetical protein